MDTQSSVLDRARIEEYAQSFLPKAINLAKSTARRLKYLDVEEFESIAIATLGVALTQCPNYPESKHVWGYCRKLIRDELVSEARAQNTRDKFTDRALAFKRSH